jgi:hypothetical protein
MPERPLGKKPFVRDPRDLKFKAFRRPRELPARPKRFGNETVVTDWGVLGNNDCGDCVWAGAAHEHMLFCGVSGTKAEFKADDVIADYSAVTGYKVGDDATDNGTIVRDALKYRVDTGIKDANGTRHKIGAFVRLEPGNTDYLFEALWLFDVVGIGIEFPDSAFDQFDAGEPWRTVKGASIDGGHYIPLVARRNRLVCVTWGKLQEMTLAFYKKYCDEAWAFISEDDLKDGKSIEGFDLEQLKQHLDTIGN